MLKDRRAHERVYLRCPVTLVLADGSEVGGTSLDLSEGGVLVFCDADVSVGAKVRISMRLEYGTVHLPMVVRRHCEVHEGRAFGAQFLEPSPRARDLLRRSLAELIMRKALPNVSIAPRPRERVYDRVCLDGEAANCFDLMVG